MSNIFPPKLMPILEPLPEINNIHPLDYVSNSVDKFPPMKTPRIQALQNETITYPEFRNQSKPTTIIYPAKKAIAPVEIIKEVKPIKDIVIENEVKEVKKIKVPRSKGYDLYIIILYIILIILIYYVLQLIL